MSTSTSGAGPALPAERFYTLDKHKEPAVNKPPPAPPLPQHLTRSNSIDYKQIRHHSNHHKNTNLKKKPSNSFNNSNNNRNSSKLEKYPSLDLSKSDIYNTLDKSTGKKFSFSANNLTNNRFDFTENPAMILYSNNQPVKGANQNRHKSDVEMYYPSESIKHDSNSIYGADVIRAKNRPYHNVPNQSSNNNNNKKDYYQYYHNNYLNNVNNSNNNNNNNNRDKDMSYNTSFSMDFVSASQVPIYLDNSNFLYEEQEGNFDLQSEYSFRANNHNNHYFNHHDSFRNQHPRINLNRNRGF